MENVSGKLLKWSFEGILSREAVGPDASRLGQPVDTRAEQHLIEMIRKTTPICFSLLQDHLWHKATRIYT